MMWQRIIAIILISWFIQIDGRAQILDDSTKQVYGPSTTEFTLEENIKLNDPKFFPIDTLLGNRHRFNFVNRQDNRMQDLGNVGTAIRPIYYQLPEIIGRSSGFNSFNTYFISPESIRYYDTKSPYTKLGVAFGGNGRSIVDISFSRSDSTVFNIGFDFKRITSDKQVGATLSRGDRNVESTAYDIYARWHPGKYQLLMNFSRMKHQQFESGGVIPLASGSLDNLFIADSANIWLNNALSEEIRFNLHLFHQFQVGELLQIYHQFDLTQQEITFQDPSLSTEGAFFDQFLISEEETSDESIFETIRNEAGVKGRHKGIFYNFYLERRDIQYKPKYLVSDGFQTEYYLGSKLRYRLGSQTFKFQALVQDGGSHKFRGSFENKFVEASFTRIQYSPSFLDLDYFGNHREWHNSFSSPSADMVEGMLKFETESFKFYPKLRLTNINGHIYFNQLKVPEQASGSAQVLSPEISIIWRFFNRVELQSNWIYATVTGPGEGVFRIPEWLINTQLSYTNSIFDKKLEVQFGLDTQYRSAYFGHDYDPVVQQFFLQDSFEIPQYFLADLFTNFRVGRALIFAKLVFLNQGFDREGYFTAPFYLGQSRVFDWGFTWQFYD